MKNWIGSHQMVIMSGLILVGYMFLGYATFMDGSVIRKIATIYTQPTADGCATHTTTKKEYKRGELVEATVIIDKYRNVESTIQWNLMDARFYPYAARRGVVPVGHHRLIVPIEKLPLHIPPGEYYFSGTVKYEPNPIADIFLPVRTNKFMVME